MIIPVLLLARYIKLRYYDYYKLRFNKYWLLCLHLLCYVWKYCVSGKYLLEIWRRFVMSGISRSLTIKLDMVTKSRCMKSKDWVIHVRYYCILSEYTISKNMECLDNKCKHNNQYLLNFQGFCMSDFFDKVQNNNCWVYLIGSWH
jgi:hypothetical protein